MLIYQTLIRLLSPLVVILTALEAIKKQGRWSFFSQRLALYYPNSAEDSAPIWIHCASVGEVMAAAPLIKQLKNKNALLITTNTLTGQGQLQQLFGGDVTCAYCPLDYPFAIKRFLNKYQPCRLWVMETEIWPNLYRICHQRNIEISLLNARLSKKSFKIPNWLKQAYQHTLDKVSLILARNQQEANRFQQLGASSDQIRILGNLKYSALGQLPTYSNPVSRPFILLASSHNNEEAEITKRWLLLERKELLIIVPRHPKRTKEIQASLPVSPEQISVHSKKEPIELTTRVYLDDRMGMLMPYFAHAEAVIMGGAFVPKGGHNVLEPAACGAAILTGPDMSDFEEETQLLRANDALIQCNHYDALFESLMPLLEAPDKRQAMGARARQQVVSQAHILDDYLKALLPETFS